MGGGGGRHRWTKLLRSGPFSREGPAAASCGELRRWLSVRLSPLRSFQRQPFARAHRVSAWSHVRAGPGLGKADAWQRRSEAELNRPPRPRGADRGRATNHNNAKVAGKK